MCIPLDYSCEGTEQLVWLILSCLKEWEEKREKQRKRGTEKERGRDREREEKTKREDRERNIAGECGYTCIPIPDDPRNRNTNG